MSRILGNITANDSVFNNLTATNTVNLATVIMQDVSVNGRLVAADLYVAGDVVTVNSIEISGNLHASGNTVLGDEPFDTLTVNGNSYFADTVNIIGLLDVHTISHNGGVTFNTPINAVDMVIEAGNIDASAVDNLTLQGSNGVKIEIVGGDDLINLVSPLVSINSTLDVATISHSGNIDIGGTSTVSIITLSNNPGSVIKLWDDSGIELNAASYIDLNSPFVNITANGTLDVATIAHTGNILIGSGDGYTIDMNYDSDSFAVSYPYINLNAEIVTVTTNGVLDVATISHLTSEMQISANLQITGDNGNVRITDEGIILSSNVATTTSIIGGALDVATVSHNSTINLTAANFNLNAVSAEPTSLALGDDGWANISAKNGINFDVASGSIEVNITEDLIELSGNTAIAGTLDVTTVSHNGQIGITATEVQIWGNVGAQNNTDEWRVYKILMGGGGDTLQVGEGNTALLFDLGTNTVTLTANGTLDVTTISHSGGTNVVTGITLNQGMQIEGTGNGYGFQFGANDNAILFTDPGIITLRAEDSIELFSDVLISANKSLDVATISHLSSEMQISANLQITADNANVRFTDEGIVLSSNSATSTSIIGGALDVATISHLTSEMQISANIQITGDNGNVRITDEGIILSSNSATSTSIIGGALDVATISHLSGEMQISANLQITADNANVRFTDEGIIFSSNAATTTSIIGGALDVATVSHNGGTTFNTGVMIEGARVSRTYESPNLTANTFYTVNHALAVAYPQVTVISNNEVVIPWKVSYNDTNNVVVDFSGNTVNCYVTVVG